MSEFVSYEVVQTQEVSPLGVKRYRIYGLRENGTRSVIDMLYLRDHDVRIKELEAQVSAQAGPGVAQVNEAPPRVLGVPAAEPGDLPRPATE